MPQTASPAQRAFHRSPVFWSAVAVGVLAFAAFIASVGDGLVLLDDYALVRDNPYVQRFQISDLAPLFTSLQGGVDYIPITTLSYALERGLFGPSARLVHFDNVLLHVFNAVMVFLLLRLILSSWIVPVAAAALFAVHPAQVESVTWISERKNVLSMAFLLVSFYLYVRCMKSQWLKPKVAAYVFSLIAFVLAVMSKPVAVVLPLLLVLYQVCFARNAWHKILLDLIPYLAIALAVVIVAIYGQQQVGSLPLTASGFGPKAYGPSAIALRYLASFAFPMHQAPYQWPVSFHAVGHGVIALSLLVSLLLLLLIVRSWRRHRVISFALIWFFIALLPVMHVVRPLNVITADRHLYIASVGLALAAAYAAVCGSVAFPRSYAQLAARSTAALYGLAVAGLLVLSWHQIGVWTNSVTLYRASLLAAPEDPRVRLGLGQAYAELGLWQSALPHFQAGAAIEPLPDLRRFLGIAYRETGDNKAAIPVLENLVAEDASGTDMISRQNLALAYADLKQFDKAVAAIDQAIALDSANADLYNTRGVIYQKRGSMLAALREFEQAVRLNPASAAARTNYGLALLQKGETAKGIEELEKAIALDPAAVDPHLELAKYYERQAQAASSMKEAQESYRKAAQQYLAAARYHPENPQFIIQAIQFMAQGGDAEAALRLGRQAAQMYADDFAVQFNLGALLVRARQPAEALARFQAALAVAPDEPARQNTQQAIDALRRELSAGGAKP